jgi:hypothetical protein
METCQKKRRGKPRGYPKTGGKQPLDGISRKKRITIYCTESEKNQIAILDMHFMRSCLLRVAENVENNHEIVTIELQ